MEIMQIFFFSTNISQEGSPATYVAEMSISTIEVTQCGVDNVFCGFTTVIFRFGKKNFETNMLVIFGQFVVKRL